MILLVDCSVYIFSLLFLMSTLVHKRFHCDSKKLWNYIGKNFISIHDTSLVKYRVYNKMYTRIIALFELISIKPNKLKL